MKLPKSWNEITIEQFIELSNLDASIGSYSYNSEALSVLSDTSIEEIEDVDIEDMANIMLELNWAKSQPKNFYRNELLGMVVKPISKLTLFEYIDLEHYFANNYISNLAIIAAIRYKHTEVNKFSNLIYEPYSYSPRDRQELFLDLPITEVYGLIQEFLQYRDKFLKTYENLFNPEAEDDLTPQEKAEMDAEEIKEIEDAKKSTKWSWELMIYTLCDGDLTKYEALGELPLVLVFNMLGMKKELSL
jgi:hypothetical protein